MIAPYLTTQPIGSNVAVDGAGGALVTFVGIVRADACAGQRVRALDYEAHREMAERQLGRLVDEAKRRWPLDTVRIQHRLGIVEAGEASVVVAVAAPHRAEAYAASQFLIEHLKREVPIWKRELYDDGTSQWVEPHGQTHSTSLDRPWGGTAPKRTARRRVGHADL